MSNDTNTLELAAQDVEKAAHGLSKAALAALIASQRDPQLAADTICDQIIQYFDQVADGIRSRSTENVDLVLSERDKQIVNLTLDQVYDAIFSLIKNPSLKPRKNFDPVKKKGVWWEDIKRILQNLRESPKGLDSETTDAKQEGIREGLRMAAELARTLPSFVQTDMGPKARKPADVASEIEKLELK